MLDDIFYYSYATTLTIDFYICYFWLDDLLFLDVRQLHQEMLATSSGPNGGSPSSGGPRNESQVIIVPDPDLLKEIQELKTSSRRRAALEEERERTKRRIEKARKGERRECGRKPRTSKRRAEQ